MIFKLSVHAQHGSTTNIIPTPNVLKPGTGIFILSKLTTIYIDRKIAPAAYHLTNYLKSFRRLNNKIVLFDGPVPVTANALVIKQAGAGGLPKEGYELTINDRQIVIAGSNAGLFYGIQTFYQMLPLENSGTYKFSGVEINDKPRFNYRGLMLDEARHFFGIQEVKKIIDLMASYKLNTFHWHLVDDEGWRIEIKKYPKLTSVGAFRDNQVMFGRAELLDNKPYGGFYSQQEIKEVVKYAAERHITIIPEIEMPAHSFAALRSYPEYKCAMPEKSRDAGAYDRLFSPTEATFTFLENILAEVIPLFPGKYIHIGGDEANKIPWEEAELPQKLMKEQGLSNVHDLQSYFIKRIEKFVNTKGKAIIGWDEILEGGIAPNATIMSWRGEEGGIASARQKHDVIMTPLTKGLYLDYSQSGSSKEEFSMNGYAPIQLTYAYDPVPTQLTESEKKHIIGVQGNLWTEFITTSAKVQYMLFPRVLALSEIAWTLPENKDRDHFFNHALPQNLGRLEKDEIMFRVPEAFSPLDTTMIGERFNIKLKAPVPGSKIYYSINGLNPLEIDYQYQSPLSIFVPANEKRILKTVVVTRSGKRSLITTTVLHNRKPNHAQKVKNTKSGLVFKVIKGNFGTVDQLDAAQVASTGVANDLDIETFHKNYEVFGVVYEGLIKIPVTGNYTFSGTTDDGMKFFIDDELVIDNDLKHGPTKGTGSIPLAAGFHKIKIKYFDAGEAYVLKFSLRQDNKEEKPLSSDLLFHEFE